MVPDLAPYNNPSDRIGLYDVAFEVHFGID